MKSNKKGETTPAMISLVICLIILFALGSCEPDISKETINGHKYIIRKHALEYGSSMEHDPDCHCFKQSVEKP